jgi:hypothetical protein
MPDLFLKTFQPFYLRHLLYQMRLFLPLYIKPVHTLVLFLLLAIATLFLCRKMQPNKTNETSGVTGSLYSPMMCI